MRHGWRGDGIVKTVDMMTFIIQEIDRNGLCSEIDRNGLCSDTLQNTILSKDTN